MQIHELNNFTGTLGAGAYLAVDDGNDTGKLSTQQLLAATEARIDNIIAGPAPSAEEIVDARRGADGVTYPSLGDAIRDQVGDLKSEISEICDSITNDLIASAYRKDGYYVEWDNGEEYAYAPYCYYRIDCSDDMVGKHYRLTYPAQVVFFNTNATGSGNRINGYNGAGEFVIPQNTKMITISLDKTASVICVPYFFPVSSPIVNSDVNLSDNADYKAVASYVTIDTNDLRQTAQVVEDAYINYDSGTIASNVSYKYYIIPCSPSMVGKTFNTTLGKHVAFFDANYEYLSGVDTNHTTPLFTFTVPSNTAYIVVSTHIDADAPVIPNGETYHYSKSLADDISVDEPYTGMKYCAIGDSITYGDLAEHPSTGERTPYHLVASNMLGLADINMGVSGSRMAVTDEAGVPPAIVTRVLQLDGTEDYDFITVMGGTNDSLASVPLGTISDVAQTTFAGAINVICQHLKSIYPIGRIGFITPVRYNINDSVELPYVEMMKAVCGRWGIPVYDAFHDSGISVFNISNGALVYDWQSFGYYGDELHPNWKGHEMFGRKVAEYLKTL